jgi:hypothetical protein
VLSVRCPAARHQQLLVSAQRQKRVEQQRLRPTRHEPTSKLAEPRGVEAQVGPFQAEQMFPVHPTSDGLGRSPIRQVLGERQHGDECKAPRRIARGSGTRAQTGHR